MQDVCQVYEKVFQRSQFMARAVVFGIIEPIHLEDFYMPHAWADVELIRIFRQGDQDAFSELVSRYRDSVYSFVFGVISDHGATEDISQEAFIRFWKSLQSGLFDEYRPIYPWLRTICMNLTRDYFARRKSMPRELAGTKGRSGQPTGNPAAVSRAEETRKEVAQVIESLDPDKKMVLTLRIIEGLSYQEISQQLSCSMGTVMSRLFRARMELKEKLKYLL